MAKFCPNCGNKNKLTAKFCESCGAALGDVTNVEGTDKKPGVFWSVKGWWNHQSDNSKRVVGLLGIVCVVIVGIILIIGIGQLASSADSQPTWHSVANFTGDGNKETAPFQIKGDEFKLAVTAKTESLKYGAFYIFVYPEDKMRYATQGSIDSFSKYIETDEIYSYTGPGSYYCQISQNDMDNWKIEVFDYY
jgi:hypothetical protein